MQYIDHVKLIHIRLRPTTAPTWLLNCGEFVLGAILGGVDVVCRTQPSVQVRRQSRIH